MLRSALATIVACFFSTSAAFAQMSLPQIDPMVLTTVAQQDSLSLHLNQILDQNDDGEETGYEDVDLTYRYDEGRTRQNLRNFVARTPSAVAKAELQNLISAQPALMKDIRSGIGRYGFDADNVADAFALWWINAWLVCEKRDEDPDRTTIDAVKQQVYSAFAATSQFAETSDAERQEYAEALMLQAVILSTSFDLLQDNPDMLDQLAAVAKAGAMSSGIDLTKMTLTPTGFRSR